MTSILSALKKYPLLVLTPAVCLVVGGYFFNHRLTVDFFEDALADAAVVNAFMIDDRRFEVVGGIVTASDNKRVSPQERLDALRLSYAYALAARNPLFGISGTDPSALHAAVAQLNTARAAIAREQENANDRTLIEKGLYPVEFLNALASLEDARLAFLASGSDDDYARYEKQLARTSSISIAEIEDFSGSYAAAVGDVESRAASLGGTITGEDVERSIEAIRIRLSNTRTAVESRQHCIAGSTRSCKARDLTRFVPDERPALIGSLRHLPLVRNAHAGEPPDQFVALSDSVCLSGTPGPYVFTYAARSGVSRMPVIFTGEFYFTPTTNYEGMIGYLRDTLGIRHNLFNPIAFYVCPDVLPDIARVHAVLATKDFALHYPSFAPKERTALLSHSILREPDARSYVRALALSTSSTAIQTAGAAFDLQELLNMWRQQSAGLDELVFAIASVGIGDSRGHSEGVPFALDPRTLFLAHSAFPSLYLSMNPSAGDQALPLRSPTRPDDKAAIGTFAIPYSALVRTVSPARLRADKEKYLSFEGIYNR